jgi:hypothetical protein
MKTENLIEILNYVKKLFPNLERIRIYGSSQHIAKKGSTADIHINVGKIVKQAGIELSEYVVIGIGGKKRTIEHIDKKCLSIIPRLNKRRHYSVFHNGG